MVVPPTAEMPEPLRLPHGSVRGTIGLIVTATYAYLLLQGQPVPSVLINSVVVVIAFYFGTRAAMSPAPHAPGQASPPAPPPSSRHIRTVRVILLLGFLGLAAWFLRTNPLRPVLPQELIAVLEVLGGYLSGLVVSWLIHRRAHINLARKRLATAARDIIAAGALASTAYTCYVLAIGQATIFAVRAVDALSLVVTFYFGSRVIGR
ncbi:MAG TPA: hypothetical protein VNO76_03075 [Thermoplasmata archaeon]|nr:hypothetical protein [Thermoplasmata archaeon]